jgi:hypothetical protein
MCWFKDECTESECEHARDIPRGVSSLLMHRTQTQTQQTGKSWRGLRFMALKRGLMVRGVSCSPIATSALKLPETTGWPSRLATLQRCRHCHHPVAQQRLFASWQHRSQLRLLRGGRNESCLHAVNTTMAAIAAANCS